MLSVLVRPLLILTFVGLGISAPLEPCGQLPSWTLRDLNITTRDEVGTTGTAAFAFTYNLTNQTESITCPLHSNYRCTITGTQNDNSTVIELQIGLGMLYMSVIQVLDCGDSGPTTFVGSSEVSVDCETVPFGPQTCTADFATFQGKADF
ncbi:hypothetical protein ONZ43_g922 [Nemania bipapillata]|uniref:Uncharacterized protein n=1 Tax=Nemania bipapillata TaxID=110536 RepID=A0ACC2J6T3_9PEZI|nr:hypothetical protein ONZ43_g922 [Nemania bipapillata]